MSSTLIQRRQFLTQVALGTAAIAATSLNSSAAASRQDSRIHPAAKGVRAPMFRPLPLGSIQPEGWLQRQLRLQADGLSGHLDEFWPDVGQSQWLGGHAEGWERAPYWLDGFIPLAWGLKDQRLQAKAKKHIDHIVAHQRPDGWYAPYPSDASAKSYDLWAILLANKMLVQYHEATGDAATLQAVVKNLKATLAALERTPLFDWGKFRWYEGLIPVYYVYELTGEPWLLDLAWKLRNQGFDYAAFYRSQDAVSPTPRRGRWTWEKHVVNTAMALKAYALSWRLTGHEEERAFPAEMLAFLDRYHGQATGMFSGDECLAGRSPTQGTELCAVVEALYSLEHLISVTGDAAFGDRMERIAFNALPATFSPDMWTHQYVQQVNQVQCTVNPNHMWSTNGPDSNIFGLEPNYGCCTSNLHQGWPKFVASLWMRTADGGIATMAYAPSSARFDVSGKPVTVALETDYPFRDTLSVRVTAAATARFPLVLRVPAWAGGATIRVGDAGERPLKPGSFHRVEREWRNTTLVHLRFPMKAKTSHRYNQALAIERGPLVYSLKIEESRTRINEDKPHRELPHGDFEVLPDSPWNYGLLVEETKPEASLTFEERPVGAKPFSPDGAGVIARVKGRSVPDWKLENGWAAEVAPELQAPTTPIEDLTLLPYGCTNLRVTEFPRLKHAQAGS